MHDLGSLGVIDHLRDTVFSACSQIIDDPATAEQAISRALQVPHQGVYACGPRNDRVVLIPTADTMLAAFSLHTPIMNHRLFTCIKGLSLVYHESQSAWVSFTPESLTQITRPHVKLVGLCHPETFPLPRFNLAISDLAAAIRSTFLGRVSMIDMQLGPTEYDVITDINQSHPDIVGISATFGQSDLLEHIIDMLPSNPHGGPLVIVGGSLPVLIYKHLLNRYKSIIVALGYGETTMKGLVQYWHGERTISQVHDIAYDHARFNRPRPSNVSSEETRIALPVVSDPVNSSTICTTFKERLDHSIELAPELDLLEPTLAKGGVFQLESSRGCTYACSFCPRDHKGRWAGSELAFLTDLMPSVSSIYNRRPTIARKVFLVDEEFFGYTADTAARAQAIASTFSRHAFRFEIMARADQVYRSHRDASWHAQRIELWKSLTSRGLDRTLLGIESGVDSVLHRFNKHTTASENLHAVRILSACDVPMRLTYITFDPLMSMPELIATYLFQGRRDVLLAPDVNASPTDLFDLVHDAAYVATHSLNRPLYTEIPYMLVSMECLIGSPYLRLVEDAGLAGRTRLSLGKRDACYLNPEIGLLSSASQLWIDRNFDLDYGLKSVMKLCDRDARRVVADLREVLKSRAYRLLGQMLAIVTQDPTLLDPDEQVKPAIAIAASRWPLACVDDRQAILTEILSLNFAVLLDEFRSAFDLIQPRMTPEGRAVISMIHDRWAHRTEWRLINEH